jgi:hypothetical protein
MFFRTNIATVQFRLIFIIARYLGSYLRGCEREEMVRKPLMQYSILNAHTNKNSVFSLLVPFGRSVYIWEAPRSPINTFLTAIHSLLSLLFDHEAFTYSSCLGDGGLGLPSH